MNRSIDLSEMASNDWSGNQAERPGHGRAVLAERLERVAGHAAWHGRVALAEQRGANRQSTAPGLAASHRTG